MEIRQQIQPFEKHRELRGVPKQPPEEAGPVPDGVWVRHQLEDLFQSSGGLDHDGRDYNARPGQILRWSNGREKTLDRSDAYRIGQALVERDGYSQVQGWQLDLKNWDASFYPCL